MKKIVFILLSFSILFCIYPDTNKMRIALINFNAIGVEETTVRAIEENLLTEIINTGKFEVVERSQLNKVMQELKLSNSDDFNEETATKIGNLLGVDIILIGSVNKLGKNMTINVRGIEVKTGLASFAKKVVTRSEEELVTAIENLSSLLAGNTQDNKESKSNNEILTDSDKEHIDSLKKDLEKKRVEENNKKDRTKDEKTKIDKESSKTRTKVVLNNAKVGGIVLVSTGALVLISGLSIFAVDMGVLGPQTIFAKTSGNYMLYREAQNLDMAMFATGIALMGTGAVMAVASIPLLVNKGNNVALDVKIGSTSSFGVSIKF